MNVQNHILKKYNIKTDVIEIPNAGRDDLAKLLPELGFRVGVEVGVADGVYSRILMENNPDMKLYGIDPYTPYRGYRDYTRPATFEGMERHAVEALQPYMDRYTFVRKFSVEAATDFEDNSVDFVYLDANHSDPYVTQDIEAWYPKIRPGGIMAGHDYTRITGGKEGDSKNWAVVSAVKKFTAAQELQIFVWGLEAKLPGLVRDLSRSWMVICE